MMFSALHFTIERSLARLDFVTMAPKKASKWELEMVEDQWSEIVNEFKDLVSYNKSCKVRSLSIESFVRDEYPGLELLLIQRSKLKATTTKP